jgi:hypothetical protein
MEVAPQVERKIPLTRLAASGKFKGFGSEPLHETRTAKVERNERLDAMIDAWKRFRVPLKLSYIGSALDLFNEAGDIIRGLACTSKDIEEFSLALSRFQGDALFDLKAGLFLSALINHCPERICVIHTSHLYEGISELGFRNTKDIVVEGDVGLLVGFEMKGGRILVRGSGGNSAGRSLENGDIILEGNVCHAVGLSSRGGTITVKGDAGQEVGAWMDGGNIHIFGEISSLSNDVQGGKIFHNGILIVDK